MDIGTNANGDIGLSGGEVSQLSLAGSIAQRIDHILRSKPGDWAREPDMGAYLAQYVGYPNIPATRDIVEDELTEDLQRDRLVGTFPVRVDYTPTSLSTAMVEITVNLPDGNNISVHREINPAQGINPSQGLPYTPAQYDTATEVTRTELVTLTNENNVFELTYLPINNNVFIVDYNDNLELDEDGYIDPVLSGFTQTIDLEEASSLIVSGQIVSGDLPSGIISLRDYKIDYQIQDIIENKMIDSIEVSVDDTIITTDDYRLSVSKLSILEPYSEYVDGSLVRHGVEDTPSGEVTLTVDFFDAEPIVSIDSYEQDSAPNNVFPRHRLADKNFVTTKHMFNAGTYFIQYLSYELEV